MALQPEPCNADGLLRSPELHPANAGTVESASAPAARAQPASQAIRCRDGVPEKNPQSFRCIVILPLPAAPAWGEVSHFGLMLTRRSADRNAARRSVGLPFCGRPSGNFPDG